MIASGLSNQVIASKLGLSTNTISNHISNIFGKLQVGSRAEAIVRARSARLGN
jgi:DNA-binding NarL/FixJ family response regulator